MELSNKGGAQLSRAANEIENSLHGVLLVSYDLDYSRSGFVRLAEWNESFIDSVLD